MTTPDVTEWVSALRSATDQAHDRLRSARENAVAAEYSLISDDRMARVRFDGALRLRGFDIKPPAVDHYSATELASLLTRLYNDGRRHAFDQRERDIDRDFRPDRTEEEK
ncbi:hypothetical protein LX16_2712 [Stackebrandtia albiflava]|uniref:Uncharacterized protein n=1 Tax=Stackebrandtia albiflava TaxID=406432 RepID=A0A562V248_9ACTN|nr:hypothetical protein [Stackebrandtia albiflava]TWJ11969.1 hypothetical protein LX16_2712 [Stackebrandtia albiflava]